MYGTLFNMRAKPGREPELIDIFNHWDRELKHNMKGAVGGLLFKPDGKPEEFVGLVVFRDKKTYLANADNPEQDRWYGQLREQLESDPSWTDGEYVAGMIV